VDSWIQLSIARVSKQRPGLNKSRLPDGSPAFCLCDAPSGCFKDGVDKTMPKTMGECALVAIMEGWMPMAMFCANMPRPPECVTLAQQEVIAAWVAAGMPK